MGAMRFWISWNEPTPMGDFRPNGQWPVSDGIKAYWCSGYGGDEDDAFATVCAVVDAFDEENAKKQIELSWPNHGEWRFCEEKEADWKPGSRFPWPEASKAS